MERYLITNNGKDVEKTKSLLDYLIKRFIPEWFRDLIKFIFEEVSNFEIFKNLYLKILQAIRNIFSKFEAHLSALA